MVDNLLANEIELTSLEMEALNSIEILHRYVHGRFWEMPGSPYTVANLWDE
jgi:alcohol dehydrogenase (NADP+)